MSVHIHSSLLCQLRGPRSNYTVVAKTTLSSQILVPNSISQQKKSGFLGEMADSRTRTRNTEDIPGASCCVRN